MCRSTHCRCSSRCSCHCWYSSRYRDRYSTSPCYRMTNCSTSCPPKRCHCSTSSRSTTRCRCSSRCSCHCCWCRGASLLWTGRLGRRHTPSRDKWPHRPRQKWDFRSDACSSSTNRMLFGELSAFFPTHHGPTPVKERQMVGAAMWFASKPFGRDRQDPTPERRGREG